MFFVFDLSLFFPDPNSVVSGDAVIVPRALKESTQLREVDQYYASEVSLSLSDG